jgi:mannitol-1-/sugar-/sorbitol-6-phosphatase
MERLSGQTPADGPPGAQPYRRVVISEQSVDLPCRAVLFDVDGVLLDSTATAERAWSQWAIEHSLPPAQVLAGLHGRRSIDTVGAFLPEALRAAGFARIEQLEQSDVAGLRPIPGVVELLAGLAGNWAIVTSGTSALLAARLTAAGLPSAPVVVTGDDVSTGKPAPDGYLKAAAALGVANSAFVVVEDSPAGVEAGRAAGASRVLGVGALALSTEADPVVRDLRGVTWNGAGLRVAASSLLRTAGP